MFCKKKCNYCTFGLMKYSKNYLVCLQFLGFRFSGWQKQKNAKTLHDMVDKTLSFVLEKGTYKTIGSSRTDAKVSANCYYFQLLLDHTIDETLFLKGLNTNFAPDLRAISIKEMSLSFNVINAAKLKEYHYYFSFGEKNHPFAAPFMIAVQEELDIELMQQGAKLFEGTHYFHKYCTKPSAQTIVKRTIDCCAIVENTIFTASFFPEKSFYLKIKAKGFLRYQVRLIMAALFELGKGNLDLAFIEASLKEDNDQAYMQHIAPASGLQLYDVTLGI